MMARFRLDEILADREKRGKPLSQSELSRKADVHFATVHRIYHNLTTRVDLQVLEKLSNVLGCKLGDLIAKDDL